MNKIISILYILFIIIISGCSSPIRIEDYYVLYPPDDFYDSYYLMCKLSDGNDPFIDNVKYIKWSSNMIILQQSDSTWWVIEANGSTLKCCNNDHLIGPLDENSVQPFLSKITDVIKEVDL